VLSITICTVIFCAVKARFGKGWLQKRATRGSKAGSCDDFAGDASRTLFHRSGLGLLE
jgi:hypothetical protein